MSAIEVRINGKAIKARPGETLVNIGLLGGLVMPHDCLSGQCDTCRVNVVSGDVDAQGTRDGGTVLACQARSLGDAEITYEEIPGVGKWAGSLAALTAMPGDVWEVVVDLDRPVPYLPGQYVYVAFDGLPERAYSPTIGLDGFADELKLVFHIRVYPGGEVSSLLGKSEGGKSIGVGAPVAVRGPYGHAYLRRDAGRLVFISNGTGWAPIWSMALAARLGQPGRDMAVVTGASKVSRLYMEPALHWLRANGVKDIVVTAGDGDGASVLTGFPSDHLPPLTRDDTVYVAGSPSLVEAVVAQARAAGARCHADPFTPAVRKAGLASKIKAMFSWARRAPGAPSASTA